MAYSDIVGAFNSLIHEIPDPAQLREAFEFIATFNSRLHVSDDQPTADELGDLWFEPDQNRLYMWNGSQWIDHAHFHRITIRNYESDHPAIDLSENSHYANPIFKIETNSPTADEFVTFGTTDNEYEYAWKFDGDEEFRWIHGTNGNVCNIDKDGITTPQLEITHTNGTYNVGDFVDGFTNQVSDKLDTTAFNTYVDATPKIYYQDATPTTPIIDGSLWYDTTNTRLLVWHSAAWVQTDRVEDTAMKTSLYNAVNNSTDYASLKSNLLTALS